ncbi:MAG: family 78 glycoside hydrolase catalytic domain [Clostridia bacterium]
MKKLVSFVTSCIMILSCMPTFVKAEDKMPEIYNLQTEYLTEPLGIDETCPRFSWNISSNNRGTMQSAYQIIVLDLYGDTVWDSGKVESDKSNNIEYEGLPLESKSKYYWKVKIWDNYGNESPYSRPASFETAFLKNEWEAEWITVEDETYPKVVINFDTPTDARYIRLNASKLGVSVDGWGERSGYRLQLAEFEIYSSNGENVALGKAVSSPQAFTNATWTPGYIVDGERSSGGNKQGYTSQIYTNVDTNVTVTVDLGANYNVGKVVFYPRNDAASINPPCIPSFPQSYKIEYSTDNINYSILYSAENVPVPTFEENTALPVFGRNFSVDTNKEVAFARAYASGLGLFEMHINGEKVTDAVLEPGETNFDKKAFYVTYDITDKIVKGDNAVGVYMGKGFYYNPSGEGRYNRSPKIWGPLMFISQIEVTYTDGTKSIVVTDDSWRYAKGPVKESVWLGGEDYDANCEIENFAKENWDMSNWNSAQIVEKADYPFERLEAKAYPSIKAVDTVAVDSITEITNSDGTVSYTVKFERNFAGVYSFKGSYEKGKKLTFRPAEHINIDGTVNQGSTIMWGSSGSIYDTYTFRGEGEEVYTPKFVYHGFQYLQIDGSSKPITKEQLTGYVYRCDNKITGSISASDENVTKVHQMITNSISDNMFNVLTDCPHREKLGWLEVSHLLYPSIANNFNVAAYMEKISDDMIDAQKSSGSIPSIVPPLTVGKSEHALRDNSDDDTPNDPTWCGANIMVPWYTYVTYGDTRQLEKAYDSMSMYFDYLTQLTQKSSTPYILESSDLNRDLGDWMSVENTSVTFVVSCTYFQLADTMAKISTVLGKDAEKYTQICENVKNAINEKYFDSTDFSYGTSQSANAIPLYLGIVPEGDEERVAEHIAFNAESRGYHLSAGEVGLKPVFNMLSEYGYSDYAYKMIMNETSPSYYYFVSQGKTTLPEIWNGGASQNHCMAGHGEGWLYEYLGGIRNDSVAYKTIVIDPYIAEELTSFEANVDTAYGNVLSQWEKIDESVLINVTVPANTTAKVYFNTVKQSNVKENGIELSNVDGVQNVYNDNGKTVAIIGSGSYSFTMPLEKTVKPPVVKLEPSVTAKGGSNGEYAADGNVDTAFKIENQTESEYPNQYVQFELTGTDEINKIVVKKQKIALGGNTTYWGDHAYAVGCVLEGSMDGDTWETVHVMNKKPDGLDNQSEVVVNLEKPKAYKFIRYIRKENNSYIGWASNGGNKLILSDIEFYATKLSVNNCFADNMVIQQNQSITISGKGENGAVVNVSIASGTDCIEATATVSDEKWQVDMQNTLPAGDGYIMSVTTGEYGIEYENIAIGDVYLIAGQSNMERLISLLGDASPENGNINPLNDSVRIFNYYKGFTGTDGGNGSVEPLEEPLYNTWSVMNSQNAIKNVSAIGYYFADEIVKSENVPVGIYSVAVGGSGIDKWLPGGVLYNSRIYPFKDMKIKGVLWYQGEQDAIESMSAENYADKMAQVIDSYRELWNEEDLPFYYAELMRIESWKGQDSLMYDFTEIRKGQARALCKVKNKTNIGIVPTLDFYGNYSENTTFRDAEGRIWTGNARTDIHPWNKQAVATRFAAFVLRDIYGRDLYPEGPLPKGAVVKDNKIIIGFNCTGDLKIADAVNYMDKTAADKLTENETSVLGEFEISADGTDWYDANANITEGKFIEVYSEKVENPLYVRYAHSTYPEMPNLTDNTNLPPVNFELAVNEDDKCICIIKDAQLNVFSAEEMNANVIFSSCTETGTLENAETVCVKFSTGVNTVTVPDKFADTKFNVMIWDTLENMNPLCSKIMGGLK